MLALAIPLVILLGAAFLWGPVTPRLKITRSLGAESVSPGTPVVVTLSAINEGPALEEVTIEDTVPPALEVIHGESSVLASLPTGGVVEIAYTVRGKRGAFEFRDARVTASEHLGVFRRRVTLPVPGRLFILPEVSKMRQVAIRPLRTRAYAGPVPARQGGSGVAFYGVREYQSGDPLRWINWRMSARHSHELFTNEFEQERVADVGLILDARRRSDVRGWGGMLFEHAVAATASLALSFLNDGNRVGLLVYGGFLDWTFPGYGKLQRKCILEALAKVETGDSLVFESFDYLPTRLFPAKSQLVLVSPLCAGDLPMLVRLCARGYQLLVVSPDPVSFEARALKTQPGVELAARIAHLERALLLRKLRRAGIQVVDWQVDRPIDRVVHASLGRTPQWFRAVGVEV
ncbi:MAG: DUF58 domain-containing protein [Anaerolineae bacterium]|nr:DUF58 domain-containing protein [Anaerolineae bacterium]